jgi:hypothetical protein
MKVTTCGPVGFAASVEVIGTEPGVAVFVTFDVFASVVVGLVTLSDVSCFCTVEPSVIAFESTVCLVKSTEELFADESTGRGAGN